MHWPRVESSTKRWRATEAAPRKQRQRGDDEVLLPWGRNQDSNAATSTSSGIKKPLLLLFTALVLVLPYFRVILRALGTDNNVFLSTSIHHPRSDFITVNANRPHQNRITPLDPQDKFSLVHISKCAGSTWIRLFKQVLNLNVCPGKEAGVEHSVSYQQHHTCKDATYTLISLRSPRHHVWSQFTMCKYSRWGNRVTRKYNDFPRSGDEFKDDEVDFDSWLDHFLPMGIETNNHYNCYHPANFQSRALTSILDDVHDGRGGFDPNMTLAMNTYNDLDFVALVEFMHESQCLLYYRLGDEAPPTAISYLSKSCKCEEQHDDRQNATLYVQHHNKGKRFNLRNLPATTLSKVAELTTADSSIYMNALKNFMTELAWLELDLGRRVVCDETLKKWEPELAYLDDGRFNVTQLYQEGGSEAYERLNSNV